MYAQTNKVLLVALVSAALLHGNAAKRVEVVQAMKELSSRADEVAGNEDDCARVSKNVKSMAEWQGEGSKEWQGVYKCAHPRHGVVVIQCAIETDAGERQNTPQCWVKSKQSDLETLWNGIVGVVTDTATVVASLFLPAERPDSDLETAIADFMNKAGAGAEMSAAMPDCKAKPEDWQCLIADMRQNWQSMSAFEKEITVLMLNNAQASTAPPAAATPKYYTFVQVAEGEQKTEGFWKTLFQIIGALFKAGQNSRRRAAANHYMSMNIGWGHVRSNMRNDGWRW